MNINRLNSSWQVPKVTPVRADTPRVKDEQGSVPKPTVENLSAAIPRSIEDIEAFMAAR